MEDDLHLGLYVVLVLCAIVIAMSLYKLAYSDSYMTGNQGAASLRVMGSERSDFMGSGSVEPPVFWNMGSVEDTNTLLQNAAASPDATETFKSRDLKNIDRPNYA